MKSAESIDQVLDICDETDWTNDVVETGITILYCGKPVTLYFDDTDEMIADECERVRLAQ